MLGHLIAGLLVSLYEGLVHVNIILSKWVDERVL